MMQQRGTLFRYGLSLPIRLAMVVALCVAGAACISTSSEEALIWCGPATAQMIIENNPGAGCPGSVLQEDLWLDIQANRVDTTWDTDPRGMEKVLENTCSGWHWSPLHRTDEAQFMHAVAFWYYTNNYPAAVVLDTVPLASYPAHAEHWVYVHGVIADQDPTAVPSGTTVGLDYVLYVDPSPPALGDPAVLELVTGSTWFAMLEPVAKTGSTYDGEYVAVIEPPEVKGKMVAVRHPIEGDIIHPDKIRDLAMKHLHKLMADPRAAEMLRSDAAVRLMKQYGLPSQKPMENLELARPLEPLLVNRRQGGYYVIPLAFEGSRFKGHAQAAVAINAYDGSFQELGMFKPTRFAPPEQIRQQARELVPRELAERVELELIYPTARRATNRLMPVWQIRAKDVMLTLDHRGEGIDLQPRRWLQPSDPDRDAEVRRGPRRIKPVRAKQQEQVKQQPIKKQSK